MRLRRTAAQVTLRACSRIRDLASGRDRPDRSLRPRLRALAARIHARLPALPRRARSAFKSPSGHKKGRALARPKSARRGTWHPLLDVLSRRSSPGSARFRSHPARSSSLSLGARFASRPVLGLNPYCRGRVSPLRSRTSCSLAPGPAPRAFARILLAHPRYRSARASLRDPSSA